MNQCQRCGLKTKKDLAAIDVTRNQKLYGKPVVFSYQVCQVCLTDFKAPFLKYIHEFGNKINDAYVGEDPWSL